MSIKQNDAPSTTEVSTPVREQQNLTTVAEIAPTIVESADAIPSSLADADAGYQSQGVPPSLMNPFVVATFDWAPENPIYHNLAKVSFPEALQAIPNIAMKLAAFKYMLADVEVEVKMNTSSLHFGAIMAALYSRLSDSSLAQANYASALQISQHCPIVMSAASRNTCKFVLRNIPLTSWNWTTDSPANIGTIFFQVLAPLKLGGSADSPSTVRVIVQARFLNMKLNGYGDEPSMVFAMKRAIKGYVKDPVRKQSGKKKDEAGKKSEAGIVSTVLATVGSYSPLLAVSPLAEFAPLAALAGTVAPFFKSLGLSKPVSQSAPERTVLGQRFGMSQGTGLALHERLALHPDAMMADIKDCELHRPDILDLSKRPQFLGVFFFDKTMAAGTTLRVIPVNPACTNKVRYSGPPSGTNWSPGHMAFYSQFFRWWRGSIKYHVKFFTSQFTTARIRFMHNNELAPVALPEVSSGDRAGGIVDIRGDTEFEFTLPAPKFRPWMPVPGFNSAETTAATKGETTCQISVVIPPSTIDDEGDTSIYYAIWASAGDDYDLRDYCGFYMRKTQFETEEEDEIEPQSLSETFARNFKPLAPALFSKEQGYVNSERSTNIVDLLHIECPGDHTGPYVYSAEFPWNDYSHSSMLVTPFMYYRGSMRHRFCLVAPTNTMSLDQDADEEPKSLWYAEQAGPSPLDDRLITKYAEDVGQTDIMVETPWPYRKIAHPFVPDASEDYEDVHVRLYPGSATYAKKFFSCGDDFLLGGIVPPPTFNCLDAPSPVVKNQKSIDQGRFLQPTTPSGGSASQSNGNVSLSTLLREPDSIQTPVPRKGR